MAKMYSRTFEWRFAQPREALWPALADTARFNEAAGLPKHQIEEVRQPDGSNRFFAKARKGLFNLAWEEIPVEWVDGQLGCESRMAVMSAAWFVEFRQRLPWLLHVD